MSPPRRRSYSVRPRRPTVAGNAYDDVYICDTTGSVNNNFLGELTVEHLRPASDDTAQFLGSDANSTDNWALVDEAGTYNGADYVASSTVGQRDLYVPAPIGSSEHVTGPRRRSSTRWR